MKVATSLPWAGPAATADNVRALTAAEARLRELLAADGRTDQIELVLSLGSVRPDDSGDELRRRVDASTSACGRPRASITL